MGPTRTRLRQSAIKASATNTTVVRDPRAICGNATTSGSCYSSRLSLPPPTPTPPCHRLCGAYRGVLDEIDRGRGGYQISRYSTSAKPYITVEWRSDRGKKIPKVLILICFGTYSRFFFYGGNSKCLQTLIISARNLLRRLNSQCDNTRMKVFINLG